MSSDSQYIDQTFRRSVYLERLKQSLVNEFGLTLNQINKVLDKLDVDNLTVKQLDKALVTLDKQLAKHLGVFADNYRDKLRDIFADCVDFEVKSLNNAYDVGIAPLSTEVVAVAATQALIKPLFLQGAEGVILDDLIKNFTENEVKRIKQVVRAGHFEGLTNQQLVQKIRGTRSSKFKDGVLQTTTRNAEAIVRTGVQTVANEARSKIAKQNSDIVIGEQIIATLDSRVSVICRSLDGRLFRVGEGRRPPFHVNCRSTFILVIDPKYAGKGNTTQRASKDGLVANQSYYEWLRTQPKAFQDDVLGENRAKLFRDGGLTAEQFAKLNLNNNFKPMTLDEMRQREPLAFERAGI